jgi:hypothetical protein
MRLAALLPALGLAGQALASSHACQLSDGEIPSDKQVKEYFSKLAPITKKTLLHDTTGPEAGALVSFPPPAFSHVREIKQILFFLARRRCSGYPRPQPPRVLGLLAARCVSRLSSLAERAYCAG